jgi:hypothetical protein
MEFCLIEFKPGLVSVCADEDKKRKVIKVFKKYQHMQPERAAETCVKIAMGIIPITSLEIIEMPSPSVESLELMDFGQAFHLVEEGGRVKANIAFCLVHKWRSVEFWKEEGDYKVEAHYNLHDSSDSLLMRTQSIDNVLCFMDQQLDINRVHFLWQRVEEGKNE